MSVQDAFAIALLSVRVASVAVLVAAAPAIALGWALARRRFRGKALVQTLVSLPMVLPPVAVGLVLLLLFSRNAPLGRFLERAFGGSLLLTWWAAALAASVMAFPFLVFGAKQAFEGVPVRIEQVAASLGATRSRVFFRVTIPLAIRGILHGATYAFARALGEFGATIIVAGNVPGRTETLALGIYARIESFQEREAIVLSCISVVLALAVMGAAETFLRPRRA